MINTQSNKKLTVKEIEILKKIESLVQSSRQKWGGRVRYTPELVDLLRTLRVEYGHSFKSMAKRFGLYAQYLSNALKRNDLKKEVAAEASSGRMSFQTVNLGTPPVAQVEECPDRRVKVTIRRVNYEVEINFDQSSSFSLAGLLKQLEHQGGASC